MAKIIKYNLYFNPNKGHGENPELEEFLVPVEMGWNETNEDIARTESHNGEYVIFDDGLPEPHDTTTQEERISELEEALDLLLSGVVE